MLDDSELGTYLRSWSVKWHKRKGEFADNYLSCLNVLFCHEEATMLVIKAAFPFGAWLAQQLGCWLKGKPS